MDIKKITNEILTTLHAMNKCWTKGWHHEELRQYTHPDAVAIVPATLGRLE
jgi:hypothetical protein